MTDQTLVGWLKRGGIVSDPEAVTARRIRWGTPTHWVRAGTLRALCGRVPTQRGFGERASERDWSPPEPLVEVDCEICRKARAKRRTV